MEITVETIVETDLATVWSAWNNPEDIRQWNAASSDWHTTDSKVDFREGGGFSHRMEAKDGSMGFDFAGNYTKIVPQTLIEYSLEDQRRVKVEFSRVKDGVLVRETFDAESVNSTELQRQGWQAILDNFRRYVESKS